MVGKRTILLNEKEVAIRSYEVSIWTLQDSFITVLKWSNLENKGQIQQPKVTLDSDGTENFSFSIPMYLHPGEENPIWYNTLNGNLMIGMRKIKVILNKTLDDERVFEFLITKVKERHEKDQLYCDVECEGLAFHELGKIGYKIALSQDEFFTRHEQWFEEDGDENTEPHQNINYWNEEFLELEYATENQIPNKWYYKVEMNWDSYGSNVGRESNKIYEDEYVASWELSNNQLVPSRVETAREKYHSVEISESNVYNITQKIAESFGVFCRYEYGYDANYHIISRTIIYYNNFIEEENGHMDLTYPYHTSEITREMDSTELTTKLFVRPVDYEYSESGQVTIMSVDANKSREDYILNFEYLHKFNIITDEQYAAVKEYEKAMHTLNLELENISRKINYLQNRQIDLSAENTVLQNGLGEAEQQAKDAADHITTLLNDATGTIIVEGANAKALIIKYDAENKQYYVTMPFVGIIPEKIVLYQTYSYEEGSVTLDDEITAGVILLDDITGDINKIVWSETDADVLKKDGIIVKTIWLTCQYVPNTYWTKVQQYWEQAKKNIEDRKAIVEAELELIEDTLAAELPTYEAKIAEQKALRKEFEEMMGPALREGYWQPEDYNDYDDKQVATFISSGGTVGQASYTWDETVYNNDDKITYYEGQDEKTYLVAILDTLNATQLSYIKNNYDNLSFIYYDKAIIDLNTEIGESNPSESQALAYIRDAKKSIHIGAGCRFGFVKQNDTIKPALIIESSKTMTDDQITFLKTNSNSSYQSKLGILDVNVSEGKVSTSIASGAITISSNKIVNSGITAIYPRVIIDSLLLKHATQEDLLIKLNDTMLAEYEDYAVLIESYANNNIQVWKDQYFINLKPEAYFKTGAIFYSSGIVYPSVSISYSLSNADIMIYLDALQVSKENSQPKVSYTIKLSMYDPYIIHNIYNKMLKIVHINDNQLKFENVQGYISHIEMMLDTPWNDTIEVKNYKTKFEDLFSSIVAQTSAMEKKSFSYDVAAAAFNSDGSLTNEAVEKMLSENAAIFNAFLDSHFDTSQVVEDKLSEIFNEAGDILSDAGSALVSLKTVTTKNADILAGFATGANDNYLEGVNFVSTDGTYTSAVKINKDDGIFIGASKGISIFSGSAGEGGASVDLNKDHLLLGVSSGNDTSAAEFTKDHIILAVGGTDNTKDVTGTSNGLIGAKFTKDSIGFATGSGNNISAILMNGTNGVTIGSGVDVTDTTNHLRSTNGSYVRIAPTGIDLGSTADLYINTNNFKLQTNSGANGIGNTIFAIGSNLNNIGTTYTVSDLNNLGTVNFLVNSSGAYIKGDIVANSFILNDSTFTLPSGKVSGLDTAITNNSTVSTAASNAENAKSITDAFTTNGLLTNYWWPTGTGNNHTDGTQWKVALVSTGNLLVGATSGLWIAKSSTYSDGAAVVVDKNGIALAGSKISLNASSKITITSGATIDIASTNFVVNSAASTNNSEIFKVGDTNSYVKYIKKTGTNANNELQIKGDVVATSFQLMINGTATNLLDSNGQISSSLIDTSDYAVNGLTTIGWGITTTNKPQYVALSSTNGLLLGAQKEIVIPRFTPVQLDSNTGNDDDADSADVIVKISNDGIYFNYYENSSDINPTNQISIDDDGIQMTDLTGQLKPIWSQDNIVIMSNYNENSPAWNQKQEWIEYAMRNKSDGWVLIKPYYTAEIYYIQTDPVIVRSGETHTIYCPINTEGLSFGNQASWYTYEVSFEIRAYDPNATGGYGREYTVVGADSPLTISLSNDTPGGVTLNRSIDVFPNPTDNGGLRDAWPTNNRQKFTFTFSQISTNLCQDGIVRLAAEISHSWELYYSSGGSGGNLYTVQIRNLQIKCTCDATTSRAPCTTYYYPITQTFDYTPTGYNSNWPNYDSDLPYPTE